VLNQPGIRGCHSKVGRLEYKLNTYLGRYFWTSKLNSTPLANQVHSVVCMKRESLSPFSSSSTTLSLYIYLYFFFPACISTSPNTAWISLAAASRILFCFLVSTTTRQVKSQEGSVHNDSHATNPIAMPKEVTYCGCERELNSLDPTSLQTGHNYSQMRLQRQISLHPLWFGLARVTSRYTWIVLA
jgi:hypothetical protein